MPANWRGQNIGRKTIKQTEAGHRYATGARFRTYGALIFSYFSLPTLAPMGACLSKQH